MTAPKGPAKNYSPRSRSLASLVGGLTLTMTRALEILA
jgi:hypothetical protein